MQRAACSLLDLWPKAPGHGFFAWCPSLGAATYCVYCYGQRAQGAVKQRGCCRAFGPKVQ